MSSTERPQSPGSRRPYRRPALRSEALVGAVLGCTTNSCGGGRQCCGGNMCCQGNCGSKSCSPG